MRACIHTHTRFADGKDAPRELVRAALSRGIEVLGFSEHARDRAGDCCMSRVGEIAYFAAIARLKRRYRGRLTILCGLERDYFSFEPRFACDYVIGSVHYLNRDGRYRPVDASADILLETAARDYGGDLYALIADYYRLVSDVVAKTGADVIGHFDLVAKFNEKAALFDEDDPRYVRAATDALDALLPQKKPFEVNTGAMARGYRTTPYPSDRLIDYIVQKGGSLVVTSDCHDARLIDCACDATRARLIARGYGGHIVEFDGAKFV